MRIGYVDLKDAASERIVRPLACFYWGAVWTLAAWCEMRDDYRSFRIDRIRDMHMLEQTYRDEPGRSLADLMRRIDGTSGA